jgi:hypothetical protein
LKITRVIRVGLLVFLFYCPSVIRAQGTYTAASCNESDVNAVINGPTHTAVSGDTINIPGGSCTWLSNLPVSVGITLAGPGASSLTIGDGYAASNSGLIRVSLPSGQTFRITGFTLNPTSGVVTQTVIGVAGTCSSTSCPNLIVDHMATSGFTFSSLTSAFIGTDNVFGVIYQNNFNIDFQTAIKVGNSAYLGVGAYGDNSWAQPEAYGTANALFIENNTFTNPGTAVANVMDCAPAGCRWVFRFNSVTNGNVGGHGTDSTGRSRSERMVDTNNNQFIDDASKGLTWPLVVHYRGGTGVVWGNTLSEINGTANPGFTGFITLDTYRRTYAFHPWGGCNGAGSYDQNDGTVYDSGTATATSTTLTNSTKNWTANQWVQSGAPYSVLDTTQNFGSEIIANKAITASLMLTDDGYGQNNQFASGDSYQISRAKVCIDQPGRGAGTLLSGSTPSPTGGVNEALSPIYEWMDATGSYVGAAAPMGSSDLGVLVNRDFYHESFNQAAQTSPTSPFNGASGTGHGTLANRPSTCTTGVGYWATDQGNWNQSGSGGQGELFVCTAANTWSLYYEPYTYPHPLTSSPVSGGAPSPPTNLQVTVQ